MGATRVYCRSITVAIEADGIATESNRGDRELSSAAMWYFHVYNRSLQRYIGGIWDRSFVGIAC
jgi:hypothetical protein